MPIIRTYTGSVEEPTEILKVPVGLGIAYPFGSSNNNFESTYTTIDTLRSNVKFLLDTEPGERVMNPEYGVPLRQYIFEPITESLKVKIEISIAEAVRRWIPELTIDSVLVQQSENRLNVSLKFIVFENIDKTVEASTHRSI